MFYQVLSLIIWGSSFIAAKYSYEMLDAALMVEARLLIAALMVLPSCYRHFGKIPRRSGSRCCGLPLSITSWFCCFSLSV